MQLLHENAEYGRRLQQGDYVARRLDRARLPDLLATVIAATDRVETVGAGWTKARRKVFAALADRDAVDDDLDAIAKNHRASLAGRGANAMAQAPYTLVYPKGIDYYTAAPLDQEVTRYQELADRLRAHLPDDELGEAVALRIEALLVEYEAAVKSLAKARRELALAATDLKVAEEDFDLTLERTHGTLKSRFNGRIADRFFPRYRSTAVRADVEDDTHLITDA